MRLGGGRVPRGQRGRAGRRGTLQEVTTIEGRLLLVRGASPPPGGDSLLHVAGGGRNRLLGTRLDPRGEQRACIGTPSDRGTTLRVAGPAAGQRGRSTPSAVYETPSQSVRRRVRRLAERTASRRATRGRVVRRDRARPDRDPQRDREVTDRHGRAGGYRDWTVPCRTRVHRVPRASRPEPGRRRSAEAACHSSLSTASSSPASSRSASTLASESRSTLSLKATCSAGPTNLATIFSRPRSISAVGHGDVGAVLGASRGAAHERGRPANARRPALVGSRSRPARTSAS